MTTTKPGTSRHYPFKNTFSAMSEVTAYHEAGHAFAALQLGGRVLSLSIDPDWDDGPQRYGDVEIAWNDDTLTEKEILQRSIIVALAGPVAEMIHTGDKFHPALVAEWQQDWRIAWKAAATVFPSKQQRMAFLEQTSIQIYRRLSDDDQWSAIAVLVDHLLAHETLEEEQIEEAVHDWLRAWPLS